MKRVIFTFQLIVMVGCMASVVRPQDELSGKSNSVDRSLKAGFAALSKKNFAEARKAFEEGAELVRKKPEPSEWLFTKIRLPDEDGNEMQSKDPTIRQITAYRHSMGTNQALLMFTSFAAQLEGDSKTANQYLQRVYGLRGPMWGTSWTIFVPPLQALFYSGVAADESENYARYLFLNGQLLYSAGEEIGLRLVREAHQRLPKDPTIAAQLAAYLVIRLDAVEAKKLAELSLSAQPKQARVLIDLAVAEWLLGNTDAARQHALEAAKLAPELPGPHATLALVAIENDDRTAAASEARIGVELSGRHPFYLLVQALAFEASGKTNEADKLIKEAWVASPPTLEDLEKWYVRGRATRLATSILARAKK
jgi:tetratricopeptide (TPR) repeat protein